MRLHCFDFKLSFLVSIFGKGRESKIFLNNAEKQGAAQCREKVLLVLEMGNRRDSKDPGKPSVFPPTFSLQSVIRSLFLPIHTHSALKFLSERGLTVFPIKSLLLSKTNSNSILEAAGTTPWVLPELQSVSAVCREAGRPL